MGWLARVLVLFVLAATGVAQVPAAVGAELQSMAGDAAVVFAGQVVEVSREDAAGFVDVRFRIDEAVRGCPKRGSYVLREWAGLWAGGPERYKVGQRRLMLLTARSASGFSAPVGGMDGAIPLVAVGVGPIADAAGVAPADTSLALAALAVDLKWIQARVVRAAASNANARMAIPVSGGPGGDWSGPVRPLAMSAAAVAPANLASVLALFKSGLAHAWTEGGDARY